MGKKKVKGYGKKRQDVYYMHAKEEGYRSRAVYKLIQMDEKYNLLRSSRAVLDLCAAPGGWSQVAVRKSPVGSLVLALDLVHISPIHGAVSAQLDITHTSKCRATIKKHMERNGCRAFDLVLHDGSPNLGGAWSQQATSQNALVIDSLKLATEFLAPRGTFVTKIFRSRDYPSVLYCLKQLFEKVEVEKPAASRSTSAEIYLVGLKYKAPAKIDPRLLDVNTLFQDDAKPTRDFLNVLKQTKHEKRQRGHGYNDGESLVRKVPTSHMKKAKADFDESKETTEEENMLNEREELSNTLICKKKRVKEQSDGKFGEGEDLTFAMSRKKKRAKKQSDVEEVGDGECGKNEDSQEQQREGSSSEDSEEERRRNHDHLEELLDQAYDSYLQKKEEINAMKKQFKEIGTMKAEFEEVEARPAKKVTQPKARKKRVSPWKLEKIRKKPKVVSFV